MNGEVVNYYELLEIEPTATPEEVKKAIKASLRKYHPDKNGTTEEAIRLCTAKTAQVNNAKEWLLDPAKRQAYDKLLEDEKNGDTNRSHETSGEDYDPQNVLRKPKYVHGSTCRPYTGNGAPRVFYFGKDGSPGGDGMNGRPGRDGVQAGQDGTNGGTATVAKPGSNGSDLKIYLDTVQDDEGHLEISVLAASGQEIANGQEPSYSPIKTFQSVDFSCKGGKGGNGGHGGRGGDGARGYRGKNATRYSNGTSGGPGGDGGDGGRGTPGGHGGRGGDIEYILDEDDAYLLMKVGGIDPVNGVGTRVKGGAGGLRGSNGRGGSGGSGGSGGNSYSYSTSVTRRDSDGRSYQDYTTHTNPGGYSGSSGRRGQSPGSDPSSGNTGADGNVRIVFKGKSNQTYAKRYDLAFVLSRHRLLSDMMEDAFFEFGETVHITSLDLKNSGFMPTPKQRVMLALDECNGITPAKETRIMVPQDSSAPPGDTVTANQGFLSIDCPYPQAIVDSRDFEPVRKPGWMKYSALQLGPENRASLARISDFQAPYSRVHSQKARDQFHMGFPIENQNGIRGVRALAAQETTFVLLTITNTSNQSFGCTSSTGRSLSVLFQYIKSDRYEIPVRQVCVRSVQSGEVVSVRPGRGDRGYEVDLPFLAAGSDYLVQVSFKLDADVQSIRPGARAALQTKIFLDDIPVLQADGTTTQRENPKRLIQSRLFEASCQPKFNSALLADVVILTTAASEAGQIQEWCVLTERLGLEAQIYSVSRYGHVSSDVEVEDALTKDCFKNKLVVFLNEEYSPQPNDIKNRHKTARPSQLFNSPYDFDESTQFLMVGGKLKEVAQLSPEYPIPMLDDSATVSPNRKKFKKTFQENVQEERTTGFAHSQRSLLQTFKVQIKVSTMMGEPKDNAVERALSRRCCNMQKWINKQDNLRHDKVTWIKCSPMMERKAGMKKTWNIGELHISLGPPSYQKSVVWVSEEDGGKANLSSPNAIKSNSMAHALISALPLDRRIDSFVRAVRGLAMNGSNSEMQGLALISRDCLVNEFLSDIATYYHGRFKVDELQIRSRTLSHLSKHGDLGELLDESYADKAVKKVVTEELGSLLASLRCCATSLDLKPWWNPLSHKHSVCKAMKEAVADLEDRWAKVFDQKEIEEKQKSLRIEVKTHIKKSRKKVWIRARGRYRAALEHLHSPTNVTKYPPTREFGPMSARVRDEHTMTTGNSQKRKKRSTLSMSPEEQHAALAGIRTRLNFCDSVLQTTKEDDDEYRQSNVEINA